MATTNLRRAVALMTASSFLVPAVGLLTQPVLARALGATGRGEMAAAVAPAVLASSVATLGLPDALTYLAARFPRSGRAALGWSVLLSAVMGLLCVLVTLPLAPVLAGGDVDLAPLIVLCMGMGVPLLVVGALRGAARGHQMWTAVAVEGVVNAGLRIAGFVGLWVLGELTVLTALLVAFLAPAAAGLVYLPLLRRRTWARAAEAPGGEPEARSGPVRAGEPGESAPVGAGTVRFLLRYGGMVWFGSVASMLVARMDQVLMVPLSSAEDLGLYTVAVTVSDVPIVVALAVSGALQGVGSRSNDPDQVVLTTRLALLLTSASCLVLGASAPLWIVPLFGAEFQAAVVPSLMLFASAVAYVPGLMAGAGLAAFGRPGLRSTGFAFTFAVNLACFVLLVPTLGVVGACWASIVGNVAMSGFMVLAASRTVQRPVRDFLVLRGSDVALAWREGWGLVRRVLRRPGRAVPVAAGEQHD
ncbi:lipopolysaccharide biosynthesis protein [Kineococcus gypseus]|uniref:lipopolysaccharide biosynthesis protein n=1 Tax=Kineococcus gypseus TaxID=1637102 RepID=UPI003D7D230B